MTTPETTPDSRVLNLSTITKEDLEAFVVNLGHPKFCANQVWQWIRVQGETDVEQMTNIPKKLR
jgi:23S rRNA (adenine2503-C2)-methyltransferase